MTSTCDALVVGAGGTIGGRLVRSLLLQGLHVRAVDRRPPSQWRERHAADNRSVDLTGLPDAVAVTAGVTTVYDLTAVTPGLAGPDRMTGVLADTHLLLAARETGVDRLVIAVPARDDDADRCWQHRFTARMARHFLAESGLQTRVARLGPVYADLAGDDTVVGVVTRRIAAALATHRREVAIPFAADAPASQVYVDDAVLGLQLVAHGTDTCGPHDVVDPAPVTVADVVAAVLRAAGGALTVTYRGERSTPVVVGDPAPLAAAVDWTPDIPLTATVSRVWAATAPDERRHVEVPPSVQDRRARRRLAVAALHAAPGTTPHRQVAGRHRYENAG